MNKLITDTSISLKLHYDEKNKENIKEIKHKFKNLLRHSIINLNVYNNNSKIIKNNIKLHEKNNEKDTLLSFNSKINDNTLNNNINENPVVIKYNYGKNKNDDNEKISEIKNNEFSMNKTNECNKTFGKNSCFSNYLMNYYKNAKIENLPNISKNSHKYNLFKKSTYFKKYIKRHEFNYLQDNENLTLTENQKKINKLKRKSSFMTKQIFRQNSQKSIHHFNDIEKGYFTPQFNKVKQKKEISSKDNNKFLKSFFFDPHFNLRENRKFSTINKPINKVKNNIILESNKENEENIKNIKFIYNNILENNNKLNIPNDDFSSFDNEFSSDKIIINKDITDSNERINKNKGDINNSKKRQSLSNNETLNKKISPIKNRRSSVKSQISELIYEIAKVEEKDRKKENKKILEQKLKRGKIKKLPLFLMDVEQFNISSNKKFRNISSYRMDRKIDKIIKNDFESNKVFNNLLIKRFNVNSFPSNGNKIERKLFETSNKIKENKTQKMIDLFEKRKNDDKTNILSNTYYDYNMDGSPSVKRNAKSVKKIKRKTTKEINRSYNLSEKEYNNFKKKYHEKFIMNAKKKSKKISQMMLNLNNSEPYEKTLKHRLVYSSSMGTMSYRNIRRVKKVLKIMRDGIDVDEFGGEEEIAKFKKDREEITTYLIMEMRHSNKPKFIKNVFSEKTISKFKGLCGDYFGV